MKQSEIIHLPFETQEGYVVYVCNQAVGITESKLATSKDKVTCKNCLRKMKKRNNIEYAIEKREGD